MDEEYIESQLKKVKNKNCVPIPILIPLSLDSVEGIPFGEDNAKKVLVSTGENVYCYKS